MFAHQPIYPNRSHPINDFFLVLVLNFCDLATKHKGVVNYEKDLRIFWGQKIAQNHHISRILFYFLKKPDLDKNSF
jgi:hypothetical protein